MSHNDYRQTVTRCMICDEYVFITDYEARYNCQKICDKCKAAVMKIREEMEKTLGIHGKILHGSGTDDDDYPRYSGLLDE